MNPMNWIKYIIRFHRSLKHYILQKVRSQEKHVNIVVFMDVMVGALRVHTADAINAKVNVSAIFAYTAVNSVVMENACVLNVLVRTAIKHASVFIVNPATAMQHVSVSSANNIYVSAIVGASNVILRSVMVIASVLFAVRLIACSIVLAGGVNARIATELVFAGSVIILRVENMITARVLSVDYMIVGVNVIAPSAVNAIA